MEKHTRPTFALVTHTKFVVRVFQGGDLCYVDGKTRSFYFRISGSKRKFDLLWFEPQFFEKKRGWPMQISFSPESRRVICVTSMEKQSHSTFALVVPSEVSDFRGFKHHFLWRKGVTHLNFVVPIFRGGDVIQMVKKSHTFALVVPSETSNCCCGFNPQFSRKNELTHASFVVPVFQGGDFCDVVRWKNRPIPRSS